MKLVRMIIFQIFWVNYSFERQSLQDFNDTFVCLQMKESLMKLQKGIGLKDYDSDSEERRSRYH